MIPLSETSGITTYFVIMLRSH